MRAHISNSLLMVFMLSLAGTVIAKADSVQDPSGSWQTWTANQLYGNAGQTPGTPYWNNASGDGPKYNVGWCLAGGGSCMLPSTPGVLPTLSDAGAAPANFWFSNAGVPDTIQLQIAVTNNQVHDIFGWYSVTGGVITTHQLFNGTATGMTVDFTPTANYGFYLTDQLGTFYTQASNDTTKDNFQAFAVFQQVMNQSYYLGVEDGGASGDRDYQDMVIRLTTVPEPASLGLLGGSLVLAGLFIRRRTSANK